MSDGVSLLATLTYPDWTDVVVLAPGGPPARPADPWLTRVELVADLTARPETLTGALLAVVVSADRDDWRLDALLRRASAAGAGAVLLPGNQPLRRASQVLADRIGVPVLGSPDPLASAVALRRLLSEADALSAQLAIGAALAGQRAPSGVDGLLGALTTLLRRPVWLLDGAGQVIAGTDPGPAAPPVDLTRATSPVGSAPAAASAPRIRLRDGSWLVAYPILTGYSTTTWLAARLPAELPAEADAVATALVVASASVRQRLAEQRLAVERDARHRAALLAEILHGNGEPGAGTRRRALDAGWQLDGWHVGIRLDVPSDVDPVALRTEVLRAFDAGELDAVVVEQGGGWAAWTTFAHEPTPDEVQMHAVAVRRAQRVLRASVATAVGVGRVRQGMAGLAATLAEAGDAARLAAARSASGNFLHVDRLGLGQLLLAWTRTDTFRPAATALLEPLSGQPGDLVRTLAAFLDAESSLTETAAVLGVHRNTVAARIARIEELLGADLGDADERLALQLACRAVPDISP